MSCLVENALFLFNHKMSTFVSHVLFLCFQVYNLTQNIQEDDLQHLQVGVISSLYGKWTVTVTSVLWIIICFSLIRSSSQNMAGWQWRRSTWNLSRYWMLLLIVYTNNIFIVLINEWNNIRGWIKNGPYHWKLERFGQSVINIWLHNHYYYLSFNVSSQNQV